jgi:hypothetical protein
MGAVQLVQVPATIHCNESQNGQGTSAPALNLSSRPGAVDSVTTEADV